MGATDKVKHCRLAKCFSSKSKKVAFLFDDKEVTMTLKQGLIAMGAQHKPGRAPAGAMERLIPRYLE